MKTIRTKVYQFSELSAKAKEYATEKNAETQEYFWSDDAIKSLEGFAEHFGAKLGRYEIDWSGSVSYSFVNFNTEGCDFEGDELDRVITNMGSYETETLRGDGECNFTGYSADEDAADGARKAYFEGERDINNLLQAGFKTWLKAAIEDYEYQLSAEAFAEYCEDNEYYFTQDGKRFHQ